MPTVRYVLDKPTRLVCHARSILSVQHMRAANSRNSKIAIRQNLDPRKFSAIVRPSSSYSLDSDPMLSILTLVASEGGSQGGERREGEEGRGRGKGREAKEREAK